MYHKLEFGRYVRTLRKKRHLYTGDDSSWTQERLAEEIEHKGYTLSVKQISDIERSVVANLDPDEHLEPLAAGLGLTEIQKRELYAKAGLLYVARREPVRIELVRHYLAQHKLPLQARTPVWDLIGINSYDIVLLGEPESEMQILSKQRGHLNLLWLIFSHKQRQQALYQDRWEKTITQAVRAFRESSFPYIHTRRYQVILDTLQDFDDFHYFWQKSDYEAEEQDLTVSPIHTITHRKYGEISFMSAQVYPKYLGHDIYISVYIPLAATEDAYWQLLSSVSTNQVHIFNFDSLD